MVKLWIFSILLSFGQAHASDPNCLKTINAILSSANSVKREQILTNAVKNSMSNETHHALDLQGTVVNGKLSGKEVDEQLQNLVQHSGFYPRVLDRKDILERGEIFIAYPLNIPETDLRLVMEYKTSIGNVNQKSPTEAYLNKMYVADRFGEKIPLVDKAVKAEKLEELLKIVPKNINNKKSFTIKELNQEVVNQLAKNLEQASFAEKNVRTKLLDDLASFDKNSKLSDIDKEMEKFNLILKNVTQEQSDTLSNLIINKERINFYPKINKETLTAYNKFMTDFYYSPYKSTKILRTQERLQSINSVKDLLLYKKIIKSENFKNWLLDRTTRHIGGIPVGVGVGALGAYIVKKSGKKDKDKFSPESINENSLDDGSTKIDLFNGKEKITLIILEKNINKKDIGDKHFIIPEDQANPLWKKSRVTLKTDDDNPIHFSVIRLKKSLIHLIKE